MRVVLRSPLTAPQLLASRIEQGRDFRLLPQVSQHQHGVLLRKSGIPSSCQVVRKASAAGSAADDIDLSDFAGPTNQNHQDDNISDVFFNQQQEIATLLVEDEFEDSNNPHPVKDILDNATSAHSGAKSVKGARIHDFCLGIPFGGLLVSSGIVIYILTGSATAVQLGLLLGGILLTLSIASLHAWKKGKSSMSYIQGQAALSFVIFFLELQKAFQTKALIPSLAALLSAAMFGFYCYVFVSGGNPPKKPKHTTVQ